MRRQIWAWLGTLLATATLLAPSEARAAFAGKNGHIVFAASEAPAAPGLDNVTGGANFDLFTTDSSGSGLQRITSGPADDSEPAWSPDGRTVVFTRATSVFFGDIFVLDVASGRQTNLTNTPGDHEYSPSWSPDGTRIAFAKDIETPHAPFANADLFVMDADGTHVTRLTNDPRRQWDPTWSPEGDAIAFVDGSLSPGYRRLVFFGTLRTTLWVVDTATGRARPVVPEEAGLTIAAPSWSPDGKRLVFWEYRDDEILVVNRDGSRLRNLSRSLPGAMDEASPSWSPDGRWISFVRYDDSSRTQLSKMRPDGSSVTPLLDITLSVETFGGTDWGPRPVRAWR